MKKINIKHYTEPLFIYALLQLLEGNKGQRRIYICTDTHILAHTHWHIQISATEKSTFEILDIIITHPM
jgi:hypothetical protein